MDKNKKIRLMTISFITKGATEEVPVCKDLCSKATKYRVKNIKENNKKTKVIGR